MEVHAELLQRIRSACDREAAILSGMAGEIVEQTRSMAGIYAEEREAERRLNAWPGDPQRNRMSADDRNTLDNAAAERRHTLRQTERNAGRPAISEQTAMQRHVAAVRAAGGNVDVALEQFARAASAGPDAQHLQTAWEQAIQARVRAEKRLAELEAERSARGKRTAQLRQTVSEAEAFMRANGMAMEAAA